MDLQSSLDVVWELAHPPLYAQLSERSAPIIRKHGTIADRL